MALAKTLNLKVVAEGVETQVQNAMLREQGYPVAQGYLFARPLSPEGMVQWFKERQLEPPALAPAPQAGAVSNDAGARQSQDSAENQ